MMKTTQLLIDHLIIGTQAIIWILLLTLCLTDISWLTDTSPTFSDLLNPFMKMGNLSLLLLITLTYPMGIIVDNVADFLLHRWSKKIRAAVPGGKQSMRKLLLQLKDPELIEYFDYLRTRIRICRSTALNFFLITLIGFCLVLFKFPAESQSNFILPILIIGLTISFLSAWSWKLLTETFAKGIAKRYQEIT